jgi:hypothetical protein
MRLWLVSAVLLVACSSNPSEPDAGDNADATAGDTGATDSASSSTDGGPKHDSGTTSSCTSPAGCPAKDVCCGTIPITGGTVPNCTTGTITTVCTAASACTTSLGAACSGTQTVRLCTTKADCTETADNLCCTFGDPDSGSLSFCANGFVAAFGGGKCP